MRGKDLRGYRNGRLVALERVRTGQPGHARWRCRCDCGGEAIVASNSLQRHDGTRSCGCLGREAAKARRQREEPWNKGRSYPVDGGERIYKTRAAWSRAVIRHYGNRCEVCGWSKGRCDAHHRIPRWRGGLNTISNGRVLCPNDHRLAHEAEE